MMPEWLGVALSGAASSIVVVALIGALVTLKSGLLQRVSAHEANTLKQAEIELSQARDAREQADHLHSQAIEMVEVYRSSFDPLRDELNRTVQQHAAMQAEIVINREAIAAHAERMQLLGKEHAQCLQALGKREAAEVALRAEIAILRVQLRSVGTLLAD